VFLTLAASAPVRQPPQALDRAAVRWVDETLKKMTLDDKVGQLVVTSAFSTYLANDTDAYEDLIRRVTDLRLGGVHLFGGREAAPPVLLNPTYSTVTLGEPLALASLTNRLQAAAAVPLLNTADFEAGAGFRVQGATTFPRPMAIAAGGDDAAAFEAARITAVEARAMGVHVNFAPLADVNNNARNPVINTRSFGEDPAAVGRFTAASIRGLQAGGMLATAKHFPGHGDTDVDSHIGLPVITHARARLDAIELAPFRAAIAAGVDVGEPGERIDVIELGRHDQRRHGRCPVGSALGTGEQPRLSSKSKAAQRSFGGVVRQADPAVLEEAGKAVPAAQ
jgi:beta-N-acetylhexosaminidase